jgi:hypothetical protein
MHADWLGLIELFLVFGGVLGFGFWQLYDLRREKRRSAQMRSAEQLSRPPD